MNEMNANDDTRHFLGREARIYERLPSYNKGMETITAKDLIDVGLLSSRCWDEQLMSLDVDTGPSSFSFKKKAKECEVERKVILDKVLGRSHWIRVVVAIDNGETMETVKFLDRYNIESRKIGLALYCLREDALRAIPYGPPLPSRGVLDTPYLPRPLPPADGSRHTFDQTLRDFSSTVDSLHADLNERIWLMSTHTECMDVQTIERLNGITDHLAEINEHLCRQDQALRIIFKQQELLLKELGCDGPA